MKVAQPPVIPLPERKPEAPPSSGGEGATSFQSTLVGARLPPLPSRKPDAPPLAMADGGKRPPVPGVKPPPPPLEQTPSPSSNSSSTSGLAPGSIPLPGRKPEPPPAAVALAGAQALEPTDAAGRIALASRQVAGLSGHSFAAILSQATQESGLDPNCRNRQSSATGPFQFLEQTWLNVFSRHGAAYGLGDLARKIQMHDGTASVKDPATRKEILGLRTNIDIAAGMAARYLSEGRDHLQQIMKRPVSEQESRIAYILGVGGAATLIKAAETHAATPAAELLPAAANANQPLFYDRHTGRPLSARETVARLTHKMETDQKAMFAAIARANDQPQRLDGASGSAMGSFRLTDAVAPAGVKEAGETGGDQPAS